MTKLIRCAALLLVLLGLAAPGVARQAPLDDAGPYAMPMSRRMLARCTEILALDAEQRAAAKALHDAYRSAFKEATATAHQERAHARAAEPDQHKRHPEEVRIITAFLDRTTALEKQLLEDLQSICTSTQSAHFPGVQRAWRRELGNRLPLTSGEDLDLPDIVTDLKIPRTSELDELLNQWELDVDRLQVDKDRIFRASIPDMMFANPGPDQVKALQSLISELQLTGGRIRDVGRRTARQIEALLPEPAREAFAHEVRARTFPRIFAHSPITSAVEAARGFADLTPEQKSQLEELHQGYRREALGINTRWAAAAEEMQARLAEMVPELMGGSENPNSPFMLVKKERVALDDRYLARIQQLLTAEQRERLPAHKRRDLYQPEFLPDIETGMEAAQQDWDEDGQ